MTSHEVLERALSEPPQVHQHETELAVQPDGQPICYAVHPDVARYIHAAVRPGNRTLETGSGVSTLAFALAGSIHTAVTPNGAEETRLREYSAEHSIDLSRVTFAIETSHEFLPRCALTDLDLVLLDGKHAFPWPMIDWFYTADRLKRGGLMMIDDADMRPVAVLVQFLAAETDRWERLPRVGRTEVFRKTADGALNVTWQMQPWTMQTHNSPLRRLRRSPLVSKAADKIGPLVRR